MELLFFLAAAALLIGLPLYWWYSDRRTTSRRAAAARRAFSPERLALLRRNFPLYDRLPPELQSRLLQHISVFLAEKQFEGAGGFDITDEVRLTIAAPACLLLLGGVSDFYSNVSTILVYPDAFVGRDVAPAGGGYSYTEGESAHAGEAWQNDYVILAWDDSKYGALDSKDGRNTILHEFAHQLDIEDGYFDGTPKLGGRVDYDAWTRVLNYEREKLSEAARSGGRTVLDTYGAECAAEFFAVATEAFFEKPERVKEKHPELYEQLAKFYGLDPCSWQRLPGC